MRKLIVLLVFAGALVSAKAQILPLDKQRLSALKEAYLHNNEQAVKMVGFYEGMAVKLMKDKAPTVKSKILPPSNDARDYISLSRYWWPDTTKKDGLPYVRHDGKVNPEIDSYMSEKAMVKMANAVDCLSLLYYVTGKSLYAEHCARYLRAWFTDSITGMNPNMTYSQFIPGRTKLRGTGILDARHACRALCMSALIKDYAGWTEHDQTQLTEWGKAFLYWMEHSTQGQMERRAKNNHGLWFDVTHMELLAFLGYENRIREVLRDDFMQKLNNQIAENGSLPQELARTLSLHYSTFVCEASLQASFIAAGIGENLWTMKTASQKSLADVVAFLYPYYKSPEKWTYKQIKKFDAQRATPILLEAGKALGNKNYTKLAYQLGMTDKSALLMPYYDVQICR